MNIAPEEMPRELARLEDENERLQEDLGEMTKLFAIEKEKNRQAIEYINKNTLNNTFYEEFDGEVKDLLEILKGSDKE